MGATSPLRKWELIVKTQLGLSRSISHVLLLSVAISLVVILYFLVTGLFMSKPETPQVELDVTPSFAESETENTDEKLRNQHTTTIMSMTIGADGQMHSETTTETMGTDANGQVHATRETQTGGQADKEAQEMMGAINNMMGGLLGGFGGGPFGGHQGGNLLDNLFGQPQPDPIMEALGLGGFGQMHHHAPAHDVFHLRDHHHRQRPRQHAGAHIMSLGDLIEAIVEPMPTIEIVEIPTMVIDAGHGHHHHHDHHGHNHGQNHNHGGHTPEIEVVKPNGNQ